MNAPPRKGEDKHDHHFTPVLYLKNFTDADGALHVVMRKDGRQFTTGPKGIGFERDLYWPDELAEGEDPNVYENQFQDFEGKAAPVIQEIITTREMPTDEERLQLLFNFIAFQFVRTPSARRIIAAPREHAAHIIMDMLESSKELYESHMRQSGYDLEKHPYEQFAQGKGKYKASLTTEGFIEGAMAMLNAILRYLHRRSWTVLASDRPCESFVVTDHPVVLAWSDGRETKIPPGHAHINTELTFPLSSHVALLGRYEPFTVDPEGMPGYVSGVNSRTINRCHVFIAACEDRFILQDEGRIITSDEFVELLKSDHAKRAK
jgi:hypothetical protein